MLNSFFESESTIRPRGSSEDKSTCYLSMFRNRKSMLWAAFLLVRSKISRVTSIWNWFLNTQCKLCTKSFTTVVGSWLFSDECDREDLIKPTNSISCITEPSAFCSFYFSSDYVVYSLVIRSAQILVKSKFLSVARW
ncbi:hypothetical protein PVAP13_4NG241911 [Panicum virgatum]|uniref:Uncharacterized protein n=1 Tax=Panicum virgatum TaxID=38727 RepID=A0A8T0TFG1_PANVG|nr:hypothetical protein PVAP13_4NG241911 [Panicum virgatum]